MKRARLVKGIKCGRMSYPAGTEVEPLCEQDGPGGRKWMVKVMAKGFAEFQLSGVDRKDFEYEEGKE